MRSDHELDQILDAVLQGYSEAEPEPGLEQRILARSLAEWPRNRPVAWRWMLAIPALACLLVFLFLTGRSPDRKEMENIARSGPAIAGSAPGTINPPASAALRPKFSRVHPQHREAVASQEPLPKEQVFPTPTPPTAEERALIEFSRAQVWKPEQADPAVVEITPIHIADLEIKSLTSSVEDSGGPSASQSTPNEQQP